MSMGVFFVAASGYAGWPPTTPSPGPGLQEIGAPPGLRHNYHARSYARVRSNTRQLLFMGVLVHVFGYAVEQGAGLVAEEGGGAEAVELAEVEGYLVWLAHR